MAQLSCGLGIDGLKVGFHGLRGFFPQPKQFSDLTCAQESAVEAFLAVQILQKAHSAVEEVRGRMKSSFGGGG